MKTATEELYDLWDVVHKEDDSRSYIMELCEQIKLFGTETNTLTKQLVLDKLENICDSIRHSLAS